MACATRLQKRNHVGVLRARRVVEGRAAPPVARAVVRAELLDEAFDRVEQALRCGQVASGARVVIARVCIVTILVDEEAEARDVRLGRSVAQLARGVEGLRSRAALRAAPREKMATFGWPERSASSYGVPPQRSTEFMFALSSSSSTTIASSCPSLHARCIACQE